MNSTTKITAQSARQTLARAGFRSAGVRREGCGFRVPANADGYYCRDARFHPEPRTDDYYSGHEWPGIIITWHGPTPAPFAEMTEIFARLGFEVTDVGEDPDIYGATYIEVWARGAHVVPELTPAQAAAAAERKAESERYWALMREAGYDRDFNRLDGSDD